MSTFEHHLRSSQQGSSQYDQEQMIPSSPMGPPPSSITSSKPKKAPSITPRRFTRFFTPVSTLSARSRSSKSGQKLRDITKSANNRNSLDGLPQPKLNPGLDHLEDIQFETPRKRRKILPTPESSPAQPLSSPCRPSSYAPPGRVYHVDAADDDDDDDDSCMSVDEDEDGDSHDVDEPQVLPLPPPQPIRRLRQNGANSRLLHRSFGGSRTLNRGRQLDHCADWRSQTADFYSRPEDCHSFRGAALPFCVTPCHTNSLIAIGDEEGGIRLVDSAKTQNVSFADAHISFRPHRNAVMDIAFSSDDFLFATASGDQTGRIIDMRTQQTRYTMQGHMSSVKQVRFQPDNDMIVATSSRDGSVKIWDLRCSGAEAPVAEFSVAFEPGNDLLARPASDLTVRYAEQTNFIRDAHSAYFPPSVLGSDSSSLHPRSTFAASRANSSSATASRRTDVSITALSFLPGSRSHLILTACESNASIKLWDIRGKHTFRGKDASRPSVPLASTPSPTSHVRNRHFGINSLALSTDGSRFYALCRDSTVYAYSANHLILGQAPEFSQPSASWGRPKDQTGLGPLYGFRHDQFKATSFYVKAAIRPATRDKSELLAVGSRDGSAVLFPTDETFLNRPSSRRVDQNDENEDDDDGLPTLASIKRQSVRKAKVQEDDIPIYEQGTPLVRGHTSEVTSMSWTNAGELVTLGDDFLARCWREKGSEARDLRLGGEVEGRRWACGWADVKADFDDDDDDDDDDDHE